MLQKHDTTGAKGFCGTNNRSGIARILNAVQDYHQCRISVKVPPLPNAGVGQGHDTLRIFSSCKRGKSARRNYHCLHATFARVRLPSRESLVCEEKRFKLPGAAADFLEQVRSFNDKQAIVRGTASGGGEPDTS